MAWALGVCVAAAVLVHLLMIGELVRESTLRRRPLRAELAWLVLAAALMASAAWPAIEGAWRGSGRGLDVVVAGAPRSPHPPAEHARD